MAYDDTVGEILDNTRPQPDTIDEMRRESDALLWALEELMLKDVERLDPALHDRVRDLALRLGLERPAKQGWPWQTPVALDLVYDAQAACQRLGRQQADEEETL